VSPAQLLAATRIKGRYRPARKQHRRRKVAPDRYAV
jgi:hypothetical protein